MKEQDILGALGPQGSEFRPSLTTPSCVTCPCTLVPPHPTSWD